MTIRGYDPKYDGPWTPKMEMRYPGYRGPKTGGGFLNFFKSASMKPIITGTSYKPKPIAYQPPQVLKDE